MQLVTDLHETHFQILRAMQITEPKGPTRKEKENTGTCVKYLHLTRGCEPLEIEAEAILAHNHSDVKMKSGVDRSLGMCNSGVNMFKK